MCTYGRVGGNVLTRNLSARIRDGGTLLLSATLEEYEAGNQKQAITLRERTLKPTTMILFMTGGW